MRILFTTYRGFNIYKWTTGKYEAYFQNDTPVGIASLDFDTIMDGIDEYLDGVATQSAT